MLFFRFSAETGVEVNLRIVCLVLFVVYYMGAGQHQISRNEGSRPILNGLRRAKAYYGSDVPVRYFVHFAGIDHIDLLPANSSLFIVDTSIGRSCIEFAEHFVRFFRLHWFLWKCFVIRADTFAVFLDMVIAAPHLFFI